MHFNNLIENITKNKKTKIFVDMDGVIACYDIGKAFDFDKKRPLISNIEKLEKIKNLTNVELYILSICITDKQIKEKNDWLNINAPFFKKENRIILSKETYKNTSSKDLKLNYLKSLNTKDQIILIDDDNQILHYIKKELKDIILYQDSELID